MDVYASPPGRGEEQRAVPHEDTSLGQVEAILRRISACEDRMRSHTFPSRQLVLKKALREE